MICDVYVQLDCDARAMTTSADRSAPLVAHLKLSVVESGRNE